MEIVYFSYNGHLVDVGLFRGKECVGTISPNNETFKDYERIFYSEAYQAKLYRSRQ